ncbi:MAG: hypothetical protein IKL92_07070 [Oscillospiraceae bacterium]|nr:hypothetical protein [Oscillospiraceae bacterium]
MNRNIPVFLLCLAPISAGFYLLPLMELDRLMLLLIYLPLVCAVSSAVYGLWSGINFLLPALCMALFIPSIFIYYNYTAFLYGFTYYVVSVIGMVIGAGIRKLTIK